MDHGHSRVFCECVGLQGSSNRAVQRRGCNIRAVGAAALRFPPGLQRPRGRQKDVSQRGRFVNLE